MNDTECVSFLQWALPRLRMRWPGFRKVRGQVCKRISRRLRELELPDANAYRKFLERAPDEWRVLDDACRITISRFYRDKRVFENLISDVLPDLASRVCHRKGDKLLCLSVGCASGEEAYTLKLAWERCLAAEFPGLVLNLHGIDSHPGMLERARRGVYPRGALKDLPESWREDAFARESDEYRIHDRYRRGIAFEPYDVRRRLPVGPFDLVLCRNLVFTYFDDSLQEEISGRIAKSMRLGGVLIVGARESLPDEHRKFRPWNPLKSTYRCCRID